MRLDYIYQAAKQKIVAACGELYERDAEIIITTLLNISRSQLLLDRSRELTGIELNTVNEAVERRVSKEPLQYILKKAWFMGFEFMCDERALIPRFDTEVICESALEAIDKHGLKSCLDICTGSGIIALSLKKLRPQISMTASDISENALSLTHDNAKLLGVDITLIQGDMFKPFLDKRFDLITINPPYLTACEMTEISDEVKKEPQNSLYGGDDGLDFYRIIANNAYKHLNSHGFLVLETGANQVTTVINLLNETQKYCNFVPIGDYSGHMRGIRCNGK